MRRTHFVTGSLAVIALALAACGSSGSKTLSEDDFITEMNAVCKTADRALKKLDPTDKSFFSDASDIIQTGLDDFEKLKAPKSLKSDFEDYVANLEDTQTQIEKLGKAVKNEDNDAAQKASDKLERLDSDNNDLAESIGADRCVDVGSDAEVPTDTTSVETTEPATTEAPETTEPETTEPETTEAPETTETPNTPLSIDTTPETAATTATTGTGGGVVASDISLEFQPITGYTWGVLEDVAGSVTPTDDPVLGPVLAGYYVGVMENSADGTPVYVYLTVLNQDTDWTADQLTAYYDFELVGDGVDQITPSNGLPARVKTNSIDGYDGGVFTIAGFGVSLLAPTGADMLGLLDAFADAQSMGS